MNHASPLASASVTASISSNAHIRLVIVPASQARLPCSTRVKVNQQHATTLLREQAARRNHGCGFTHTAFLTGYGPDDHGASPSTGADTGSTRPSRVVCR